MNAEQQQGETHLGDGGTGGTRGVVAAQQQTFTAWDQQRALTDQLMEQVCDPKNLIRAYRRVRSNKGKPGVDGMTVHELADWLRQNHAALTASLLDGTYQPQPVRGVQIPKPGRGQRKVVRSPPCYQIFCWMTSTRNWDAGGIASAATPTIATSMCGRWRRGSE